MSKKIFINSKVEKAVVLDLACRRYTGASLPVDILFIIIKNSFSRESHRRCRQRQRQQLNLLPEYNERGARVKKIKSKVRIKRALKFNNS